MFGYDVTLPWEFIGDTPARSIVSPAVVSGLPFILLRWFSGKIVSSYLLLVAPRLMLFCCSLLVDTAVFLIGSKCLCTPTGSQQPKKQQQADRDAYGWSCLLAYSWSYPGLVMMCRPFSNTIEALALVAAFTALLLIPSTRCISMFNTSLSLRDVTLGSILACGTFTRFTFILFFVSLGVFLLHLSDCEHMQRSAKRDDRTASNGYGVSRVLSCVRCLAGGFVGAVIVTVGCVAADSYYFFGKSGKVVVTPLNNALYNMKSSNLAKHGIHPRYNHGACTIFACCCCFVVADGIVIVIRIGVVVFTLVVPQCLSTCRSSSGCWACWRCSKLASGCCSCLQVVHLSPHGGYAPQQPSLIYLLVFIPVVVVCCVGVVSVPAWGCYHLRPIRRRDSYSHCVFR